MSGIEGGSTIESETTKNSKSKKRCESSMTEVHPKIVKISVPSKDKDSSSVSSMSDSVPRKKKTKTIAGPLLKGHKVTLDKHDFDKDKKVSSTVEGRTLLPLLDTPTKCDNKRDYSANFFIFVKVRFVLSYFMTFK